MQSQISCGKGRRTSYKWVMARGRGGWSAMMDIGVTRIIPLLRRSSVENCVLQAKKSYSSDQLQSRRLHLRAFISPDKKKKKPPSISLVQTSGRERHVFFFFSSGRKRRAPDVWNGWSIKSSLFLFYFYFCWAFIVICLSFNIESSRRLKSR